MCIFTATEKILSRKNLIMTLLYIMGKVHLALSSESIAFTNKNFSLLNFSLSFTNKFKFFFLQEKNLLWNLKYVKISWSQMPTMANRTKLDSTSLLGQTKISEFALKILLYNNVISKIAKRKQNWGILDLGTFHKLKKFQWVCFKMLIYLLFCFV